MPAQDKQDFPIEIPFRGKMITHADPIDIGLENFYSLKNFRYTDTGITGIGGMTKVNSTALSTYTKIKDVIHFKKTNPSESYMVVQAFNSGMTASKIYYNSTAIGSAGDFTATELYTVTNTVPGRFSQGPDGSVIFCDGTYSLIWGGVEARIGAAWSVSGSVERDITDTAQEASSTNYSVIAGQAVDTLDWPEFLLHFNNNVTLYGSKGPAAQGGDDTYTASATGTPVYSNTTKKFSYSGRFQGIDSVNNWGVNTTYELSGGDTSDWCISVWVNPTEANGLTDNNVVFYAVSKTPDASDWCKLTASRVAMVGGSSLFQFTPVFTIYNGGTTANIVQLNTTITEYSGDSLWHNITITKDATEYKMYVDGVLAETATKAVADGMPTLWDDMKIGYDGTNYFDGYIDEFAIFGVEQYTADFTPEIAPYPDEDSSGVTTGPGYIYVASVRPISGIKLYIDTTYYNNNTSESTVEYWSGRAWTEVSSLTDGTSASGKTLRQTGTMSFTSTVDSAVVGLFYGLQAYWYRIRYTLCSNARVYFITVNQPMQPINDIWDHEYRLVTGCFFKKTAGYEDYLLNVFSNTYDSDLSETYIDASSATSSYELIVGFPEKSMGIYLGIAGGYENSNASVATVKYWNGSDWGSFTSTQDDTSSGGATLALSGIMWWNPADRPRTVSYYQADTNEYKRSIAGEEPMYYYKITFSATLDSSVRIYYIAGIPAQKTIPAYKFSEMFNDRLWLFDEYNGDRNKAICSSSGSNCVFNGSDTVEMFFGDTQQITAAIPIFSKSGSAIWENLIVCKLNETYIVDGTSADEFKRFLISDNYGCVATSSMDSCDVEYENQPWFNRNGAIWMSASGPVMFDANTVAPLWYDIGNYFDKKKAECMTAGYAYLSYGYYDNDKREYHLMFPSGSGASTCNKEFVYDVRRKKWSEIDRGSGLYTQCGCMARSTTGILYQYGCTEDGYMWFLDNGPLFNATGITHSFRLGDQPVAGTSYDSAYLRRVALTTIAKTDGGSVTITHYGDGNNTATTLTSTQTVSTVASGYRISQDFTSHSELSHAYHGFGLSYKLADTGESVGFTPLRLLLVFKSDAKIKLK